MFFGTSLIAVTNLSKIPQKIKVGETFVSLMLYKMPSSTKLLHDNPAFRQDIINLKFDENSFFHDELSGEYKNKILAEIEEWKGAKWRSNKEHLVEEVEKYVKKINKKRRSNTIDIVRLAFTIFIIGFIIYLIKINYFSKESIPFVSALIAFVFPLMQTLGTAFKEYFEED